MHSNSSHVGWANEEVRSPPNKAKRKRRRCKTLSLHARFLSVVSYLVCTQKDIYTYLMDGEWDRLWDRGRACGIWHLRKSKSNYKINNKDMFNFSNCVCPGLLGPVPYRPQIRHTPFKKPLSLCLIAHLYIVILMQPSSLDTAPPLSQLDCMPLKSERSPQKYFVWGIKTEDKNFFVNKGNKDVYQRLLAPWLL